MSRVDDVDIPGLRQLDADHDWFEMGRVIGRGLQRTITATLRLQVFAWRRGQNRPELRSGRWNTSLVLARGMAIQPLALVRPDDAGFLPAGGNISDWAPHRDPRGGEHVLPGAVCYSDQWNPQRTLAWLAHQVTRILVGEVLNLEARPLSRRGRDFQAEALARGELPTQVITEPRREALFLDMPVSELNSDRCEIEFHDISS